MAEYITKKAAINAVESAPIELFQSEVGKKSKKRLTLRLPPTLCRWCMGGGTQPKLAHCAERSQRKDWTQRRGTIGSPNYCPHCGARMDGGEVDEP